MKALLKILLMSVFSVSGVALAVLLSLTAVPLPVSQFVRDGTPSGIEVSISDGNPRSSASAIAWTAAPSAEPEAGLPVAAPPQEPRSAEWNSVPGEEAVRAPQDSAPPGVGFLDGVAAGVASVQPRVTGKVECQAAALAYPAGPPSLVASSGGICRDAVFPARSMPELHPHHDAAIVADALGPWINMQPPQAAVIPCDAVSTDDRPKTGTVEVASLQEVVPLPAAPRVTASSVPSSVEAAQSDQLVVQFRDTDLRDALHALARQMNLNVLMSNSVQGTVTASLNGLSPDDAFSAIVAAHGLALHRQGNIVYVGTPADIQGILQMKDVVATRIFRPNYVTAEEIKALVEPIITPQIGKVTLSTAAEIGIAPDPTKAGGNAYAGVDIVLVRDYETVLQQIDRIVEEVDVRPAQVAIEAMIVSVNLDDKDQFGVSFELLRNKGQIRLGWGLPPNDLEKISFDGGLKVAYLDASVSSFITALESVGDTNVIASPRLLVLNKHRAEILIGKELGYVSTTVTETSASQTVDFLKVGAQLIIRPFISNDGLIRMEVHPELSTGAVQITNNFTVPNKDTTQVTTNIMVPDGVTVIIGGLMREDLQTTSSQLPFLGNLPLVGAAFRNKTETVTKQEIIVLITPHIMDDYRLAAEGTRSARENLSRQQTYAETMSPLGKRSMARRYLERARQASAEGRTLLALRFARLAVQFDPTNLEAIALRDSLQGVCPRESAPDALLSPATLDGEQIPAEILDALEAAPPTPALPLPPPPSVQNAPPGEVRHP
ncbi:MAG: hypothetical protein ACUVQK_11740 [Thermogutta sp.]